MTTWTNPGFEAVACLVNQRTGLALARRHDSAEHGMRRAMARAKVHDPAQYAERLAGDDAALDDLIGELTVGETYFFREPAHFQFIQQHILPDLRVRRGSGHKVRAWSAACATGEEAYSLAILFEQNGLENAHLAATDITRAALAKARQAIYGPWSLRGESPLAAVPFLTPVGKEYRLAEKIRQRVSFAHLNLALDAYPSFAAGLWGMDLILCRNVLIYFDGETVRRTAQRLHATLAEGGWLITASSDPPLWEHAPFEVIADADGIFYRRGGAAFGAAMEPRADLALAIDTEFVAPPETGAGTLRNLPDQAPARVAPVTTDVLDDAERAGQHVRALANRDTAAATEACARALERHPLSAELHFLQAALLVDGNRAEDAARALRRVVYLDRGLAIGHFMLGAVLSRRGDAAGARRAYRNARDLCAARPAEETVPLADGETAGRLAEIAAAELVLLEH
jgi:chemotaxis protein methyltransferase CheR